MSIRRLVIVASLSSLFGLPTTAHAQPFALAAREDRAEAPGAAASPRARGRHGTGPFQD